MSQAPITSTTMLTGNMRTHTIFTGSTTSFITDVPQSIGGRGEYPPPASILAATLSTCMLSMLSFVASKHGINTDGIAVLANVQEDANGIKGFNLRISVPMKTTPEARAVMERAVRSCPVANALSPEIEKHIVWTFAE